MIAEDNKMYPAEEAVSILQSRCFTQYCLFACIRFFIWWSLAFGIVSFIFRLSHFQINYIYWFFSGLPLAILYGIDFANKHKVSELKSYALVDSFNKAGGLLLAEKETGDKKWRETRKNYYEVPEIELPISSKELNKLLIFSIIFALACLFIPIPKSSLLQGKKMDLKQKVSEIKEHIELLEEEQVIPPEEKSKLEESLEKIVNNSDKEAPGITFESLDQIEDKLKYEVDSEMKKRIKDMELLEKLENYMKEAKNVVEDKKKAKEKLENLKDKLRKSGMSESQINDFLNEQFGNDFSEDGISNKSEMEKYSQNLTNSIEQKKNNTSDLVDKLQEKNLISENVAQKLKESTSSEKNEKSNSESYNESFFTLDSDSDSGNIDTSGTESGKEGNEQNPSTSSDNDNSKDGDETTKKGNDGSEGRDGASTSDSINEVSGKKEASGKNTVDGLGEGGISVGGGYTPLTYGDKASEHNAKYHDEVLPDVNKESSLNSVSYGIGIADPEVEKEKVIYNSTKFNDNDKNAKNINNKNLLPKYRNTVKNYFRN